MSKLYFNYGCMNSGKTANLLMLAHNYQSSCRKVLLVKPSIDTRSGNMICSRSMTDMKANFIMDPFLREFDESLLENINIILIDEAQFLSESNVDALRNIRKKIPVICYGLKTVYKTKLFLGSKRLLEVADVISEIESVCINCEQKAIINAKISKDSLIISEGSDEPEIGFNYQPRCWICYKLPQ